MTFDIFGKIFISIQHKLFYVVMSLARFNLYANSWGYLARTAFQPPRANGGRWWWWMEVIGLGLFFCWYAMVLKGCGSWGNAIVYLLVSHVVTSPLHVQVGSHILTPSRLFSSCESQDRPVALFAFHSRPGSRRILPCSPTADDCGRHLFAFH